MLKIVRQLVCRLIQLDIIRARHHHHDEAAILALLDWTSELATPFASNSLTVVSMSSHINAIKWCRGRS